MENQPNAIGKKIFLLYPHSVIRDEMLDELLMAGYETYTLSDEKRAVKLLIKFSDSIMFINIDEGLQEDEWEAYIRAIMASPKTKGVRLGIMSYNQNKVLMEKYLMELAVPCGYIQLKLGLGESTKIILDALEAIEAKGRRSSIRADCHDDINAVVNYKWEKGVSHGRVLDISSAGIAARFEKIPDYAANTVIKSVQLKLRGGIVMTDMTLVGLRSNDKNVQILLYDPKMPVESKLVIHHYIKQCLQKYIDNLKI